MPDEPPGGASAAPAAPSPVAPATTRSLSLRRPIPRWQAIALGLACVLSVAVLWWFVTLGEQGHERWVSPLVLPSPAETFGEFPDLWFERALARNMLATLSRVALGFLLAVVIGVPIGIVAGCFPRVKAFLLPLLIFGRNIPIAALIPLMLFVVTTALFFGPDENRKIMFIFIACVAFVISDTAQAIADVSERYVDTALTLGASRWQTIMKVLVPLAMPSVFASCRLMFGIAFGYIMLAEISRDPNSPYPGGVGFMIGIYQRLSMPEGVYLIILLVPFVALMVDQLLYLVQRSLFPHQYGGGGWLAHGYRSLMHAWDDGKLAIFGVPPAAQAFLKANDQIAAASSARQEPTP